MKKFYERYKKKLKIPLIFMSMAVIMFGIMCIYVSVVSEDYNTYLSLEEKIDANKEKVENLNNDIDTVKADNDNMEKTYGDNLKLTKEEIKKKQDSVNSDLKENEKKLEKLKEENTTLTDQYNGLE